MVIKRVGPMSMAKLYSVLCAIIAIIPGAFIALFSMVGAGIGAANGGERGPFGMMAGVGVAAIVVLPIMYGIFGFIGGLIGAVVYNFVAGIVGGIEIDVA